MVNTTLLRHLLEELEERVLAIDEGNEGKEGQSKTREEGKVRRSKTREEGNVLRSKTRED